MTLTSPLRGRLVVCVSTHHLLFHRATCAAPIDQVCFPGKVDIVKFVLWSTPVSRWTRQLIERCLTQVRNARKTLAGVNEPGAFHLDLCQVLCPPVCVSQTRPLSTKGRFYSRLKISP